MIFKSKPKNLNCKLLKKVKARFSYQHHPDYKPEEDKWVLFDELNKTAHYNPYSFSDMVNRMIAEVLNTKVYNDFYQRQKERKYLWIRKKIYKRLKDEK